MFTKFWTFLHWRFLHWYQTPVLFLNTTSSQRFLDLNSFLATVGSVSAVVLVDIYLLWKKKICSSLFKFYRKHMCYVQVKRCIRGIRTNRHYVFGSKSDFGQSVHIIDEIRNVFQTGGVVSFCSWSALDVVNEGTVKRTILPNSALWFNRKGKLNKKS